MYVLLCSVPFEWLVCEGAESSVDVVEDVGVVEGVDIVDGVDVVEDVGVAEGVDIDDGFDVVEGIEGVEFVDGVAVFDGDDFVDGVEGAAEVVTWTTDESGARKGTTGGGLEGATDVAGELLADVGVALGAAVVLEGCWVVAGSGETVTVLFDRVVLGLLPPAVTVTYTVSLAGVAVTVTVMKPPPALEEIGLDCTGIGAADAAGATVKFGLIRNAVSICA